MQQNDSAGHWRDVAARQLGGVDQVHKALPVSTCSREKRAGTSAVHLFVHTKRPQKADPYLVARLQMDLPFHSHLAFTVEVPALCPLLIVRAHYK